MTLSDSIIAGIVLHKWALLFYAFILLMLYVFRHKLVFQNKIIAMYKTSFGLKLIERVGAKHSELVKFIGYIGIGAGYIGLFFIIGFLIKSVVQLLFIPEQPAAVSVVLPGVHVPGSPIYIPLISGWIALFVVIVVHEFSHGIVARAHGIQIKSTGMFFLGPLMGAFVEPDEKKLIKASDTTQYSVYAAGPFSNILLAAVFVLILIFITPHISGAMTDDVGVYVSQSMEGYPAKQAGITDGMVITGVNGHEIKNLLEFQRELSYTRAGDDVTLTADGKEFPLVAANNPGDERLGYVGVMVGTKEQPVVDALWFKALLASFNWILELFRMIYILSFGIGLANLLPLGPVDGGRMVKVTLDKIKGPKVGDIWWRKISVATLVLLLFNIAWSLFLQKMFMALV